MIRFIRRAAVLIVLPVVVAGASLTFVAAPADAAVAYNSQVVILTNKQRAKHGCSGLKTNADLSRSAKAHSAYMARHKTMTHTGSGGTTFVQRARAAGYRYAMSENIAWGYRTPSAVVNGWMNSPGHRRNILNCKARSVGVGVAYATNGVPYWTQDFGRV